MHSRRVRRALMTAISCLAAAGIARAEPLPGKAEVSVGGHAMLLSTASCEEHGDVVECQGAYLFAGFEVAARLQLGAWFALGVRGAGSGELGDEGAGESTADGFVLTQRSLWLWQLAVEARFDPPIWPSGLWIGADLGAAIGVDAVAGRNETSNVRSG